MTDFRFKGLSFDLPVIAYPEYKSLSNRLICTFLYKKIRQFPYTVLLAYIRLGLPIFMVTNFKLSVRKKKPTIVGVIFYVLYGIYCTLYIDMLRNLLGAFLQCIPVLPLCSRIVFLPFAFSRAAYSNGNGVNIRLDAVGFYFGSYSRWNN